MAIKFHFIKVNNTAILKKMQNVSECDFWTPQSFSFVIAY